MKLYKKLLVAGLVVLLMVGSFLGGFFTKKLSDKDAESLGFIINSYKKYYLDDRNDYISIMGNSLLDQYSYYYTAEEYEELKQDAVGSRAGIGVVFSGNYIYRVIGNSPAEMAGIKKGGYLVGIKAPTDYEYTEVSDVSEIFTALDGISENRNFGLKIRYGEEEREYVLQKREYQETYVYYSDNSGSYRFSDASGKMKLERYGDAIADFDDNTGYVQYVSFSGTSNDLTGSAKQVEEVLAKFKENGNKNLIFDLRGNGGGYMAIAQKIAAHLIDVEDGSKKVISKAVYKDGSESYFYSSAADYSSFGFENIIFLADINTASASEVLIGAVLDYDKSGRVKVVLNGTAYGDELIYRTYGKGIMQNTYEHTGYGDAIRLTVAKIYWPLSDTCIHEVGITKSLLKEKCVEAELGEGDYALRAAINCL